MISIAATNVTLTLADALTLSEGTGLLLVTPTGLAGRIGGKVELTLAGAPVTFSGTFAVAFNNSPTAVNETWTIGGSNATLSVPAATTNPTTNAVVPFLRVEATEVALDLFGQRLRGDFAFESSGGTTTLTAPHVSASFGDGTTTFVALSEGRAASPSPGRPASQRHAQRQRRLQRARPRHQRHLRARRRHARGHQAPQDHRERRHDGHRRPDAHGHLLLLPADAPDGSRLVTVDVPTATMQFAGLSPLKFNGSLAVTNLGVAGRLTLDATTPITFGDAVSIAGVFTLKLNTATTAVTLPDGTRVDAGRYLRIEGTNVTLTFDDTVALGGSFVVQQTTNSLGQARTVLALSGGHLDLSPSLTNVLNGVNGALLVTAAGLAAQVSGTVDLSGVLPSRRRARGHLHAGAQPHHGPVNETIRSAGHRRPRPAGRAVPADRGRGARLTLAGQTLERLVRDREDRATTTLTATTSPSRSATRRPARRPHRRQRQLHDRHDGQSARSAARSRCTSPASSSRARSRSRSTPAPGCCSVGGTHVALTIFGQQLSGNFSFEQIDQRRDAHDQAQRRQRHAHARRSRRRQRRPSRRAPPTPPRSRSRPRGVTGHIAASIAINGIDSSAFALGATHVDVNFNTAPGPAGRFVRVDLTTSVTMFGQSVSGDFSFEQSTSAGPDKTVGTSDDRKIVKIAAANVALFFGAEGDLTTTADDIGLRITNGSALLLLTPDGFAGQISAAASIQLTPGVSASADLVTVRINTTPVGRIS